MRKISLIGLLLVPLLMAPTAGRHSGGGAHEISGLLDPVEGGPCAGFDEFKDIKFVEEFKQPFTEVDTATFVDGTSDKEWEQSGIVFTAVGSPANISIGSSFYETAGTMLLLPGTAADTGYNLQFTNPHTCILPALGGRCHDFDVPSIRLGQWGGHKFCWMAGFAGFVVTPDSWDSAIVIGMNSLDTSIMPPTTGVLTGGGSFGSGRAGVWDGEGFLFQLDRSGILSFNVNHNGTLSQPTGGTVNLKTIIDSYDAAGEGLLIDVGVIIRQTNADLSDRDDGSIQAYYRLKRNGTYLRTWNRLGSIMSGVDVLPASHDLQQFLTYEIQQSSTDAEVGDFGLETFLSHVISYYTREEYTGQQ